MLAAMSSYTLLDTAKMPDGTLLELFHDDGQFILDYDGMELMSTTHTWSEEMLADLGCADLLEGTSSRPKHPRVLIGGLGMGFTLKRVLELVGSPATVDVAELVSKVIEWNRSYLVGHNGPLLADPRTNVILSDLFDCLRKGEMYDTILIDIDDTPDERITEDNSNLYTPSFMKQLRDSLNPGGCLAYWMARPSPKLEKALEQAGFVLTAHFVSSHEESDELKHRIYVARLNS